jgi:DNA-binding winged helix-turn-helix (wHTH) protein
MGLYRLAGGRDFDAVSGEVCRNGTIVRLEPQPAALLALLASRAGEAITHEEIRCIIWGHDTHVDFKDGIHYCVRQIRAALGDTAEDPRFIETIPRRGYRLRADAIVPADMVSVAFTTRRRVALACAAAVLTATIGFVERQPNDHHQIAVAVLKVVHDFIF